ncbi:hypothetical protein D3C80_1845520 [compost metagenome]
MLTHRSNQYFLRNVEERFLEFTEQHGRSFYEEQDLFKQIFLHRNVPAFFFSQRIDLLLNHFLTFINISDDMLRTQGLDIIRRLLNHSILT